MKTDVKEILEKVATVANFSDEEKQAVFSTLKENTVIEGDLAQTILTKAGSIASRDFILNDAAEMQAIYGKVMGENMPKVEQGAKTAFFSNFSDKLTEAELDEIWNNPENKKLNNKVFEAGKLLKKKYESAFEQAQKGPEDLQRQIEQFKNDLSAKQTILDTLPKKHEEEIKTLQRDFKGQLFGYKVIQDMKAWGADVTGLERTIAMQLSLDYHTDIDEAGNPVIMQKSNPEAKVTDPEKGTSLSYEQVIKRDFARFFQRNAGAPTPPKPNGGNPNPNPNPNPGGYPPNVKTDRQKAQWDAVQARKKAMEGKK